ncbi:hypothetical protein BGZ61DRAFT_499916 [Ilyonectria robusta]|uniref:uncharacterized protein n=1 Tax=Ilyonectria robusta TaxID=1079257 RepID=UPI001E8EB663|nr:uncharacterized protein BGZ61DRAFT_499916 [Ilyonectria robusta]KAH8659055.1 hypothetical protein BGZ61DRAFT_499916 [Ilyonectria robusta]
MKVATACTQCRASKRKCWLPKHTRGLVPCAQWPQPSPNKPQQPTETPSTPPLIPPLRSPALSDHLTRRLVENYIWCIHDRPHSIFHLPTLRSAVRAKRLPPAILQALLSFGSLFHPDPDVSSLAPGFFEDAKRHLHLDLENVCVENVQACILIANLSAALLRASSEALYFGIAIRMAEILHLDVLDSTDTVAVQELKRRVWWTLFMCDHWCSAGNGIPRKMDSFNRTVELPMDEYIFHRLDAGETTVYTRYEPGLWAHMITLVENFGPIQDLNWKVAHHDIEDAAAEDAVLSLMEMLAAWEDNLPAYVRYNETNLDNYRAKGLGGVFMALHMGFNHYATLLYYQYLDVNRVATTREKEFAERCKQYATAQSILLSTARERGDCPLMYPGVGHSAVISSSVLLHTVMFGKEDETIAAKAHLVSNFQALKELRQYWPSLELIVRRLTVFQAACLRDADCHMYRFDKWMVRFLLEYHQLIDDKLPDMLLCLIQEFGESFGEWNGFLCSE